VTFRWRGSVLAHAPNNLWAFCSIAMGTAHARQQALASRSSRGSSGVSNSLVSVADGGPPPDPVVSPNAVLEAGQDDCIPVVFTWTHGGQHVCLAASFNGWREQIPMVRSGNEFAVVQDLPRGVHQYKFIVDDHWQFAPDQPKTQDSQGNMNNVLDITNYYRFQVGMNDEPEQPRFGQHILDLNDYTVDAPVIPMVLHKSAPAAVPPRPHITGGQPLSIPHHAICNHIYLQDRAGDSLPATVAVTHRYGQKYSTTVFATRSPFGDTTVSGVNLLKTAVLRASL